MKRFPISFSFLCNVFSHYFSSSSTCTCHDQQQFCLRTTFNVLVIPSQSAHRGGGPCGSPARQHGNRLCLMFQTGALGRTGGSARPSATGHLTVFYSTRLFLSRGRIKKNQWRCGGVDVSVPYSVGTPRRISSAHFDPQTVVWRGCSAVSEQLLELWSQPAHTGVQLLSAHTMDTTHHSLSLVATEKPLERLLSVHFEPKYGHNWKNLYVLNCFHLFNKLFPLCFSRSCRGLCDFQEAGLLNGISSWAN